ncbi:MULTISPECIES: TspO/MBR family protein [unclassified Amycolatopsis]|uniref:TspO/MBR family protein n=1 Tax=unclassified Amycolatopsis TaxID=2618356 RepID=UPI0028748AFF|nr:MULTISPECIES: TspO/MBR family protein [unclassified Amycolatopsis]MDS0132582.1 tryptophan-rich sensory protein [Amycolatopsis sp. 505]MDS0142593.1 tryptophan-rich sensory protein [Amycolatopsis sp. CM201R]
MTERAPHRNQWLMLAGFAGVVAVVAVVGGLAATSAREVYARLEQPSWAAPPSLFGPVWTVLYVTIAVAGWLYWRTDGETRGFAAYGIGLLFNLLWTPLFFESGAARVALADIVLLDVVVAVTIVLFGRRSKAAAALLVPYLAWIFYATALNAAIVVLN